MSQEWYYTIGGDAEQKGPVDWSVLQQLAAAKKLDPADLVWSAGMQQFVAASSVQGLFSSTTADGTAAPAPVLEYAHPAQNSPFPQDPTLDPMYTGPKAQVMYAGFFLRFLAYLVDGVILLCIMIPVLLSFMLLVGAIDEISPVGFIVGLKNMNSNPMAGLVLRGVLMGVAWLYFAYQESSAAQATLGKRFLGLVVTDTNGQRISFARASGRHFGKLISDLILAIGYLMAAFTYRKQALHDMIAGCLVVIKPS